MNEPILFVPGMMCDARVFGPQIEDLSRDHAIQVARVTHAETIREIIIAPSVTANEDTPLNEALSLMLSSAIGTLAILDENDRLVGVLSFDIIRDVLGEDIEREPPCEEEST